MKTCITLLLGGVSVLSIAQVPNYIPILPDTNASTMTAAVMTGKYIVSEDMNAFSGYNYSSAQSLWKIKLPGYFMAGSLANAYTEGQVIAAGLSNFGEQQGVFYWIDAASGTVVDSLRTPGFVPVSFAYNPVNPEQLAVILSQNATFKSALVDVTTGNIIQTYLKEGDVPNAIPNCIRISPDGNYTAIGTANGSQGVLIYETGTGKKIGEVLLPGDIFSVNFTSDSKNIAFTTTRKMAYYYNIPGKTTLKEIELSDSYTHSALLKDNTTLVMSKTAEKAKVAFLDFENEWPTYSNYEAISFSCETNPERNVVLVTSRGMGPVHITGYPYLVAYDFQSGWLGGSPNATNSTGLYKAGSRIFALYTGDGKYYSATILNSTTAGYSIRFDDGYETEIAQNQVQDLPALTEGMYVQCKWTDGKYYPATILSVQGNSISVKYDDGTLETVTSSQIMQVRY